MAKNPYAFCTRQCGIHFILGRDENIIFSPNCICLGEFACELITPKLVLVTLVFGALNCTRLKRVQKLCAKLHPYVFTREEFLE